MRTDGRLDPAIIEAALSTLLHRHPDASVCALGPDGLMVEMPASVPLAGHRVVRARSALNVAVTGDRVLLINAWERARAVGAARVPVRLASDPAHPAVLHLLDARKSHGVYLGVVVAAVGDDATVFDPTTPSVAPRFARAGKNVLEAAVEVLRSREQVLARLAETVPVGVLHIDAQRRVVLSNDRLNDILGCIVGPRGHPVSVTLDEQLATILESDRALVDTTLDAVLHGVDDDIEVAIQPMWAHDNEVRRCALQMRSLTDDGGAVIGALICVSDTTDVSRGFDAHDISSDIAGVAGVSATRDGAHLRATFDVLTRCYNRDSTMAALEALLAGSGDGTSPAVILVDLHRLKELNAGHGRDAGDEFLGVVARRLRGAVREDDVIGRIGGDQFVVLCPGIATPVEAVRTATRVAESLSHEVQLKSIRIGSRASIGVAWSSANGATEAEALITQAHAAMDESRRRGAGRPVLFSPSLMPSPAASSPSSPPRED